MVKSDLIIALANKVSLPFKDVEMAVNEVLDCLANSLSQGARIEIRGFGSIKLNFCKPRCAHNPKTGEKVATIGKHRPHFKPGKELRERVNAINELEEVS